MKQLNTFGLSLETTKSLKDIFSKYPEIHQVILYGSRAKGNYKKGSDIDLSIVAPSMTFSQLLKIENLIDDLMLPYKIDLSLYHHIDNPELIDHIERVGIPID